MICLVLNDLLHILMEEELQYQGHVVTVQEKLREKLELENIYRVNDCVSVVPRVDLRSTHGIA